MARVGRRTAQAPAVRHVVVSDLHVGCRLGLLADEGVRRHCVRIVSSRSSESTNPPICGRMQAAPDGACSLADLARLLRHSRDWVRSALRRLQADGAIRVEAYWRSERDLAGRRCRIPVYRVIRVRRPTAEEGA